VTTFIEAFKRRGGNRSGRSPGGSFESNLPEYYDNSLFC